MNFDLPPHALSRHLRERFSAMSSPAVLVSERAAGAVSAAVLVPLVLREAAVTVLLTRRSLQLNDHPGQICFPGGRCEAGDASVVDTALREAREEVGLPASAVEVLGLLPDYITGTGFRVSPVVGLVSPAVAFTPDSTEVEAIFEVPLRFLMDASNHQQFTRRVGEEQRAYWAMPYGEHFIWGATAGMLLSLHRLLLEK